MISLLDTSFDYVVKFLAHYPYYKEKSEIIESVYNPSSLRLTSKQILLPSDWSKCIDKFATYHLYYKEELQMINAVYDSYLCYSFDELRTIAFIYHPKTSFDPFHAAQVVESLLNNQALSNKRL